MDIVLVADSGRACGGVFADVMRMRTVGMNGDAKENVLKKSFLCSG